MTGHTAPKRLARSRWIGGWKSLEGLMPRGAATMWPPLGVNASPSPIHAGTGAERAVVWVSGQSPDTPQRTGKDVSMVCGLLCGNCLALAEMKLPRNCHTWRPLFMSDS